MGIDYDAWLEKPYREQSEGEQRYEAEYAKYIVSDLYKEDLAEWLEEDGAGKTEEDFKKSEWFETCLDYFSDNNGDDDDYDDDDRDPPSYLMNW